MGKIPGAPSEPLKFVLSCRLVNSRLHSSFYLSYGGSYRAITVHYLSVLVGGEVCKLVIDNL